MSTLPQKRLKVYRMDSALSMQRLDAIRDYLRGVEHATVPQISRHIQLDPGGTKRFIDELCATGVVAKVKGQTAARNAALYRFIADIESAPETFPPVQRRVDAKDWPRGEAHVRRTGVLSLLFPLREQ